MCKCIKFRIHIVFLHKFTQVNCLHEAIINITGGYSLLAFVFWPGNQKNNQEP